MRFLLDNDVPDRAAGVAHEAGHTVVRLRDALPREATDAVVFEYARDQGLILVTCNRDDFLPLAARGSHPGLIVLIRRKTRIAECSSFLRLIERARESGLDGNVNFA